jgi:hypothetical protein
MLLWFLDAFKIACTLGVFFSAGVNIDAEETARGGVVTLREE